jgi:TatA/E family protein of Tat protein translocase
MCMIETGNAHPEGAVDRIVGAMLNLDPGKLLVIAVVAIVLLGPDRLPEVARQVGGVWRSFKEFRHRMETEVRGSIPDLPSGADIARLTRSPSALLDHLSRMDPIADGGTGPATDTSAVSQLLIPPIVDSGSGPSLVMEGSPQIDAVAAADPGQN